MLIYYLNFKYQKMEKELALITIVTNLDLSNKNGKEESYDAQFELLSQFIDQLIQTDFNRLLRILYRVDISEEKLKLKLAENKDRELSSKIIAQMLIDRELEKIASRAKYKNKD